MVTVRNISSWGRSIGGVVVPAGGTITVDDNVASRMIEQYSVWAAEKPDKSVNEKTESKAE